LSRDVFYDPARLAIVPMGFCFPGTGKSGDLPPRRECAPAWRSDLLAHLPGLELTLAIGQYALAWHLPNERGSLTETVQNWNHHWPDMMPLPHPSPRNNGWLKRNPWFETEVLPTLQQRVAEILSA
ncbi:MAG TPA: uracil-DNA glycosylase family protein, partial [Xanthomonadales bacterium]|nr:uracil-DNA glycosylase family protein [Xanthomonadales bacterium]